MAPPEASELDEMGPIDYIVLEWSDPKPTGEVAPLLLDLVDRGIIRILDVVFVSKGEDGTVSVIEVGSLDDDHAFVQFAEFSGAATGILDEGDIDDAGSALEPGTLAAVLIWENRWAGPVGAALRRSGGQLVASGRIPIQGILAALDATEDQSTTEV